MSVTEVIATHSNTDFDAFAAMVAAHKLYPEAEMVLSGAVNRNVREFRTLFADAIPITDAGSLELDRIERLILVETYHANRLAELGPLLDRPGIEVVVFDHHRPEGALPSFVQETNFIVSDDGSLVTLMLRIIADREIEVTPLEATVFALGIHEDTGSLTFPTTTVRDVEALAFCMRRGANQHVIEHFLHNPLSPEQRALLLRVLEHARPVEAGGLDVLVAALAGDAYVEGVSLVVHKAMDIANCDVIVLLVEMEERIFVTARSRVAALDVAQVLRPLGGGGHAAAASAIIKDVPLATARRRLLAALKRSRSATPTAESLMSRPVHWVTIETPVDDALVMCERHGYGGLSVADAGRLVGSVARRDLDRAVRHRLSHAPVKAIMTSTTTVVPATAALDELTNVLARDPLGRVPVVRKLTKGPIAVDDVVGVVTRSDVLQALHAVGEPAGSLASSSLAPLLGRLGFDELFADIQAVASAYRGVFLVGGAVRDLLLEERISDIDIAVEGDGIEFARELAVRLGGRVRAHQKFQTAVIVADWTGGAPTSDTDGSGAATPGRPIEATATLRVDVASTRTEFYDYPAALPKVEHATIRGDLARRDFSINAMAVSLNPRDFGALLDFFGGLDDLRHKRIVVLHNLSFIEDPTRIFRAVRYENRYGFRMDTHTLALARACSEMDLIGDLSSARLRDELVLLLEEERISFTLQRLKELGLQHALHPRLALDDRSEELVGTIDRQRRRLKLAREMPTWRARLVVLLRDLEPEEIEEWVGRMKLRRRDADVLVRSWLVGVRLERRLRRPLREADLYEIAKAEPLEALLVAMAVAAGGPAEERLARFITHSRRVRLAVSGRDLLDLGFRQSADLGSVLQSLLRMKLNGVISGRRQELEAARRMRAAGR
jgi:tRNA nucleotidyltransferase (CCA-adding enzyme)